MTTSSLYRTYAIISMAPHSSSEFQTHKDQGGFPKPRKEGHQLVDTFFFIKADPFEYGDIINSTLDGVSICPVTTKIQVSFLTQLPEKKETAQGLQ